MKAYIYNEKWNKFRRANNVMDMNVNTEHGRKLKTMMMRKAEESGGVGEGQRA